jgi:hypothetical protein
VNSYEVPREEWNHFFDDLSQSHQGWEATIELQGSDFGAQNVADKVPLLGITAEHNSIEIGVGDVDSFVTHMVSHPEHVRVAELRPGEDVAVEIDSESGPVTVVQLHPLRKIMNEQPRPH